MYKVEVDATPSINCFIGSLEKLFEIKGVKVTESELLACSGGFLLEAGLDEWQMPELTFSVENVGLVGARAYGGDPKRIPIAEKWREQLRQLLKKEGGVIVWVNSRWLDYADVYSQKTGYLHAILVTGISDNGEWVHIVDSLIVDRVPWACNATLRADVFEKACTARVRSEAHDHMGYYWVMRISHRQTGLAIRDAIIDQANQFLVTARFNEAVREYKSLNLALLRGGDEQAVRAARRIFDHIVVLYIIPGLLLLEDALVVGKFNIETIEQLRLLRKAWHALSIMALKYEATLSPAVLERIELRFDDIQQLTLVLWKNISSDQL
ncbi:hypothetical protein [Xenorhabdus griffiniae]|uniref:Butirosin biosynthesis protein H N-terminal domain-containing protein n=1 Tax=Xenorhabdus griffiniae TaxID=351672 RepID=A0ABY9XJI6_9GAMM|nr:hypothetical protein [Xenorhabdus griffiniae]MBD1228697.1 hypothetical protein [Xenorhabdus griffiniae]MBE8588305.1 hypothetical protein [Xenorhabdus griffiniae]WMV73000.1 hypothetical protein QL128_02790 [Xenorhabdus griffiniae]WNH02679.1 hypothetical protein QL112_002795 [Xenorhabdus griffiniae]